MDKRASIKPLYRAPISARSMAYMPQIKQRRPKLHEMDRLDTKTVRSCVQSQEPFVDWETKEGPIRLKLLWQERKSGTFGPGSSAYANYLRRCIKTPIKRDAVARIGDPNDRGRKSAWILYFNCPTCSRCCRVLYSRKGKNDFGCVKCNRPAYPSNSWAYTGRKNGSEVSETGRAMLRHEYAAQRITRKISEKRKGERVNDLNRLKEMHEKCALILRIMIAQKTLKSQVIQLP